MEDASTPLSPPDHPPAQPAGRDGGQTGGGYAVNTSWTGMWDRVNPQFRPPKLGSDPHYGRAGKDQALRGLGGGERGQAGWGQRHWGPWDCWESGSQRGLLCWRERNLGYFEGVSNKEGQSHWDLYGKKQICQKKWENWISAG